MVAEIEEDIDANNDIKSKAGGKSEVRSEKPTNRSVKHGDFGKLCTSFNEFQKKDVCGYEFKFKLPPNSCGYEHYCEHCFEKQGKKEPHKGICCPAGDSDK